MAKLLAGREARGGPLTEEEVAKLEFAANQGVLSAYFDLHWHHSTDGDPSQEQSWFDEGVKRGEPNLLVILAGRQKAEAEDMPAGPEKTRLLRQAKENFQAALTRKRLLSVASVETVREDIGETDKLLRGESAG